jgi:hypothetical protein
MNGAMCDLYLKNYSRYIEESSDQPGISDDSVSRKLKQLHSVRTIISFILIKQNWEKINDLLWVFETSKEQVTQFKELAKAWFKDFTLLALRFQIDATSYIHDLAHHLPQLVEEVFVKYGW